MLTVSCYLNLTEIEFQPIRNKEEKKEPVVIGNEETAVSGNEDTVVIEIEGQGS